MNCPKCGSRMNRFVNPERWICPTPDRHAVGRGLGSNHKGGGFPKGQKREGERGKKKK